MSAMTTLYRTYSTEVAARRAVDGLRGIGVADRDIRLLTSRAPYDVRREPVGGFAGPVGPDAPVGTYGGVAIPRRRAAGGFAGDPDEQRQGSFASTDRVVIFTYDGDTERTRVTGLRGARRLLDRASLGDDAVERAVSELHKGHAVVLVQPSEPVADEARAGLERLARAA
jgi:hypothetical protein